VNAVEIEEAISLLADQAFDAAEFPYAFLESFGNKAATIKRLRSGNSNKSDVGGVLQTNNIHMLVCGEGEVTASLDALRGSLATTKAKAKFILATDGVEFEAENTASGETVACDYAKFPDHFGFFLALAGISTVKEIRNSAIDIKATGRLNRLYIELLKNNPGWSTPERRHDMNHFMARLIFCFFAEDTDIFLGDDLFTSTVEQMSDSKSANTHEIISETFRAMGVKVADRPNADLPRWANGFPYVNGGLFTSNVDVPKFSRIARKYLLHAGRLDWQQINPDIFGSMIQAVADDEERGSLGMHYTSVENILKLLNPLFLDDLREQLAEAGESKVKLLNLRKRMAKIRIFDPACGSGNFLVIAYKQMREIEYEINKRRIETNQRSEIPLTNFRGIELRDFPAEIARLALIIAEFQCDVIYRGQQDALAEFLPLNAMNWITQGNALRVDWLSVCPPTGTGVKLIGDDLFSTPLDQAEIEFENEGGETYICGNPPYAGLSSQGKEQKDDLEVLFEGVTKYWKSFDYVSGWLFKSKKYMEHVGCAAAFVTTNSICQGQQVPMMWPIVLKDSVAINFAHSSFKWSNLAARNAGVTVVIIGITNRACLKKKLYSIKKDGETTERLVNELNAYLIPTKNQYITPVSKPYNKGKSEMVWGNKPVDGGSLILSSEEANKIIKDEPATSAFIRPYFGSEEYIRGKQRFCIWVKDEERGIAEKFEAFSSRFQQVKKMRASSKAKETRPAAEYPHRFRQIQGNPGELAIIIPIHTSENRHYLPVGLLPYGSIISNAAYGIYNAPIWNMSIIASSLHLVWIATVCGKIKTDFRYSNTLGWNTFPIPKLTEKNKDDLSKSAEDILLARETHFPATIADLYNPDTMPDNLRYAHKRNDEVLERIYIGRRFKNDTERLEKLFDLYTKMTSSETKLNVKKAQG